MSARLCLGPSCLQTRDQIVCCEAAANCSTSYTCPHGYLPKPIGYCAGTTCGAARDRDRCCDPAMPCTNLTCPVNFVTRPNSFCSLPVFAPVACTLEVDNQTCCVRGMALTWFRFSPIKVRDPTSHQVQLSELILYFFGQRITGSVLEEGGIAYSVDGNFPVNENPSKAIDENIGTKWLEADRSPRYFPGKVYQFKALTVKLPFPKPIDHYSFVTGNDIPGRDPIQWILEASTDNVTWVVLDSVFDGTTLVPELRQAETNISKVRVPCYAPKSYDIPNSVTTYPCLGVDVIAGGDICVANCLAGYVPSVSTLACTEGQLIPDTFTCDPL